MYEISFCGYTKVLNENRIGDTHDSDSSDLDSILLQVLVGLNIVLDRLFDHISGLLAILLNPISIKLVVALRSAFLH